MENRKAMEDKIEPSTNISITPAGDAIVNGKFLHISSIELTDYCDEGACGVVLIGKQRYLDRKVAVKLYTKGHRDHAEITGQGITEAKMAVSLDHPHIVKVYSSDIDDHGRFYVVMEYLDGVTLEDYLEKNERDIRQKINYWDAVSSALLYAQSKGIYHGDLHLRNIMVGEEWLRLIDFANSSFLGNREWILTSAAVHIKMVVETLFSYRKLEDYIAINLSSLHPDFTLCGCVAWGEFLISEIFLKHEMSRDYYLKKGDDYMIQWNIFHFSILLAAIPVFNLEYICKWAQEVLPNEMYVHNFLNTLKAEVNAKIKGQNMFTISHENISIEQKLSDLIKLYDTWRKLFLSKSPSEIRTICREFVAKSAFDRLVP
jgi:tRNA A-37 threonylcarbamoyl transferase component Bud32